MRPFVIGQLQYANTRVLAYSTLRRHDGLQRALHHVLRAEHDRHTGASEPLAISHRWLGRPSFVWGTSKPLAHTPLALSRQLQEYRSCNHIKTIYVRSVPPHPLPHTVCPNI